MTNRKRKGKIGDYDIGYGKTPPWTRFPPKQSGNPGGRPRKAPKEVPMMPTESELDNLLRAELDRELTINDGGKPKKIKARELVPRSQINSAIKGNSNAQRHVMLEMRELARRDADRARLLEEQQTAKREQQIKTYEYMVREKEERTAIWAEAETRGCEPKQPWPHPDDILLFPNEQRWKPRGPFDERDLAPFNWYRAERDYLFAYGILDGLQRKQPCRALQDIYTFFWVSYDVMLPKRWQLVGNMEAEFFRLHFLPMKKLEKLVDELRAEADFRKALAGISDEWDKESYKTVNLIMKPLLKRQGYRSLREFEHAFEMQGENMPQPKLKTGLA